MKRNDKECPNYCTIALTSHGSKIMFKILQARLQQYVIRDILDVETGFRKAEEPRHQIVNVHWITEKSKGIKKKKNPSISALLTALKSLTAEITKN